MYMLEKEDIEITEYYDTSDETEEEKYTLVSWDKKGDGEIIEYYSTYEEAEEGMKIYYALHPDWDLSIE